MAGPTKRKTSAAGKGAKKKAAAKSKAKPARAAKPKPKVTQKKTVAKKAVVKKAAAQKAAARGPAKKAAVKKTKAKAAPAKTAKKAASSRALGTKSKATASKTSSKPAASSGRRALNTSLSLADRAARGARSSVQTLTADKSRRVGSRSTRGSQEVKSQTPRTVRATRSAASGVVGAPPNGATSQPAAKPPTHRASPHGSADVLALEPTHKAKTSKVPKAGASQTQAESAGSDAPQPKAAASKSQGGKVDLHTAPREFLATLQDDDDKVIKPQD